MDTLKTSLMTRQIAEAASTFWRHQTGHTPHSVTVVQGEETLVITLHGALSPAEKALARSAAGAAQVQEFHRQLFASSADALRREIRRITGVDVQEAAAEVEPATGTVVHAFTTGNVVQVFHMASRLPVNTPGGDGTPTHVNHDPGHSVGHQLHKEKEDPLASVVQP
jgi:uncharacterized protein YbcI